MLESDEFIATHRTNPTDFTRRRTLTLSMLVICLAQGFIKGLQSELDDFFGRLGDQAAFVRAVTKSAFSQARKKLKPSAFKALNSLLLDRWYQSVEVPRWHGFRLLAADSTTLRVPGLPETIDEFGLHGGGKGAPVPMAMAFGLYEVFSGLMLHADLHEGSARDRDLMAGSLSHVRADDLLLLDRGFPSYWLIAWLLQHQRHFCMRVDAMAFKDFEAFLHQSTEIEKIVTITMPAPAVRKAMSSGYALEQTTFTVRLIRVPLPVLTEDRRRDLAKMVRQEAEQGRVAIRNVRRDAINDIKELLKDKLINEDQEHQGEAMIQEITDKHVAEIEKVSEDKQKEIMEF